MEQPYQLILRNACLYLLITHVVDHEQCFNCILVFRRFQVDLIWKLKCLNLTV